MIFEKTTSYKSSFVSSTSSGEQDKDKVIKSLKSKEVEHKEKIGKLVDVTKLAELKLLKVETDHKK